VGGRIYLLFLFFSVFFLFLAGFLFLATFFLFLAAFLFLATSFLFLLGFLVDSSIAFFKKLIRKIKILKKLFLFFNLLLYFFISKNNVKCAKLIF